MFRLSPFIALLALSVTGAPDRFCYRFGFACDCITRVCEGGAVMPKAKAKTPISKHLRGWQ